MRVGIRHMDKVLQIGKNNSNRRDESKCHWYIYESDSKKSGREHLYATLKNKQQTTVGSDVRDLAGKCHFRRSLKSDNMNG